MNRRAAVLPALLAAFVVLSGSALALNMTLRALNIQLRKLPIEAPDGIKFHTLPSSIPIDAPRWVQHRADEIASAEALESLGTSNYITRWFRRDPTASGGTPDLVQLHCAYYTGMIDTVPHVPERCMVGGGMEIAGSTRLVDVPLDRSRLVRDPDADPSDERGALLMGRSAESRTRVRLPRGVDSLQMMVTPFTDRQANMTMYAGYFFIANGGVVASANDVRLLAFRLEDRYAYYAKVQFLSPTARSPEHLAELAADMLDDLLPDIMRRLPDWTEVEEGRYPVQDSGAGATN